MLMLLPAVVGPWPMIDIHRSSRSRRRTFWTGCILLLAFSHVEQVQPRRLHHCHASATAANSKPIYQHVRRIRGGSLNEEEVAYSATELPLVDLDSFGASSGSSSDGEVLDLDDFVLPTPTSQFDDDRSSQGDVTNEVTGEDPSVADSVPQNDSTIHGDDAKDHDVTTAQSEDDEVDDQRARPSEMNTTIATTESASDEQTTAFLDQQLSGSSVNVDISAGSSSSDDDESFNLEDTVTVVDGSDNVEDNDKRESLDRSIEIVEWGMALSRGASDASQADAQEPQAVESHSEGRLHIDDRSDYIASQPLQTLRKLQHMLDETDYMTAMPQHRRSVSTTTPTTESRGQQQRKEARMVQPHLQQEPRRESIAKREGGEGTQDHHQRSHIEKQGQFPLKSSPLSQPQDFQRPQEQQPAVKVDERGESEVDPPTKLWTSRDRRKYKVRQEVLRRVQEEQRRLEQQIQASSTAAASDDEATTSDPEDGLGYELPNLPVYMSDVDGTSDGTEMGDDTIAPPYQQQQQLRQKQKEDSLPSSSTVPPPYPQQQQQGAQIQQQQQAQQSQQQFVNTYQANPYAQPAFPYASGYGPSSSGGYPLYPPPPPPTYPQQYTPEQQQQMLAAQFSSAWAAAAARPPYSSDATGYIPAPPSQFRTSSSALSRPPERVSSTSTLRQYGPPHQGSISPSEMETGLSQHVLEQDQQQMAERRYQEMMEYYYPRHVDATGTATLATGTATLAEASAKMSFDSIRKLGVAAVCVVMLCYAAVSPRDLPLVLYNDRFNENIRIVSFLLITPLINAALIFDARFNDINSVIHTFYSSFTVGYVMAFCLQILATTVVRLGVFAWWEPKIFSLTPRIPVLVLPWILRDCNYPPKRITLFIADFLTSCVACPLIEEFVKMKILQLSVKLPKNFVSVKRKPTKKNKRRRQMEPIVRRNGEEDVTNINLYVTHMLAASLGMKLFDSARRILMYTKDHQEHKSFYAFARGIFPIHELCGTMTALALAKRDVLGVDMPLWRILIWSVLIHAYANFKGTKPIFKWNSSTPWSEMQLSQWNVADDSTPMQLVSKSLPKVMWLIVLLRALGYCIKNYYMINRQAVKRVTTYAGKHAAFSAELAATEALKKKN